MPSPSKKSSSNSPFINRSSSKILGSSSCIPRLPKRVRLIPFLTFFIFKALCSLVILNLYMGSQISLVPLEDSFSMMLHRDSGRVRSNFRKGSRMDVEFVGSSNSKTGKIKNKYPSALNSAQNKDAVGMITPNSAARVRSKARKGSRTDVEFVGPPNSKTGKIKNKHPSALNSSQSKDVVGMITPNSAGEVRSKVRKGSKTDAEFVGSSNSTTGKIKNKYPSAVNSAQSKDMVGMITPNLADGTLQGKERLWNILQTRNLTQVDASYWASIPSWDTILQNIYHTKRDNAAPIIHGLETCQAFQDITSSNPSERRIAPAGLFNTGTNYLSVLLEYNCQNPHRVEKIGSVKRGHGNEWEVPWGKHVPANFRGKHFNLKSQNLKYTVDEVLPIVLIRNPYGWMKSMCRNPYTAKWRGMQDKKTCPKLKDGNGGTINGEGYNPVDVTYGAGAKHHQSLGHLWNDWYGEYFYKNTTSSNKRSEAPFPRLVIRFEDIIFFPYEVTKQICTCAGGVLGHRQDDKDVTNGTFHYVVRSAKAGMGHGPASKRNGLIDSWLRYGSDDPKDAYSESDIEVAKEILDSKMTKAFDYA